MRVALHACQVSSTAAALRAALPAAMQGDERAVQSVKIETANLSHLASSFSSQSALVSNIERNAGYFLARTEVVLKVTRATQLLRQQSAQALEASQDAFSAELAEDAAPARISAAAVLAMLTQRMGKSAAELLTLNGIDPEAVFLLGKDAKSFQEILTAMTDGSSALRIKPAKTPASKQRMAALTKHFTAMKAQVDVVLLNLQDLVGAREAQAKLQVDLATLGDSAWKGCSSTR